MKKYKSLQDLPFAEAGEELYIKRQEDGGYLTIYKDLGKMSAGDLYEGYIENFGEWFEEAVEEFYFINEKGFISTLPKNYRHADVHLRKAIGNYFKTKEEAEKYLKYLKARVIIKEDTKGFKPDWDDEDEPKYMGRYSCISGKTVYDFCRIYHNTHGTIFFKTTGDIKESFEKHPEEWKVYLTYEQ